MGDRTSTSKIAEGRALAYAAVAGGGAVPGDPACTSCPGGGIVAAQRHRNPPAYRVHRKNVVTEDPAISRRVPSLRVVVEGLVIVGSILLAFGIQAWWDGRQEEERIRNHLLAIASEVEGARATLQVSIDQRQHRTAAIHSLLLAMGAPEAPTPDSVVTWLGVLWGARGPARTMSSFDDLRESGGLASVHQDELRRALAGYGAAVSSLAGIEERVVRAWEEELRPFLVANTDTYVQLQASGRLGLDLPQRDAVFDPGLSALLEDRTFQNLLLVRLTRTGVAQDLAIAAQESLDEVARLLESEGM
jgi:hypothetical protein